MTTSGGTSAGPPFRKECRLDEEANATLVPQGATCRTKKGRRGSSRLCTNDLIPSVPFSVYRQSVMPSRRYTSANAGRAFIDVACTLSAGQVSLGFGMLRDQRISITSM